MIPSPVRRILAPSLATALLAGCATTKVEGSWTSPSFRSESFSGPVFVVGVARDETVRRIYEDLMTEALSKRGVDALRSYEHVPRPIDAGTGDAILSAARLSAARHVLSTAVIARGRETVIYNEPAPLSGFGSWYGAYWAMSFPSRSTVREYAVYSAETSLTDVASDRVEWTLRTRTTPQGRIETEVRDFVDVVLAAMADQGFLKGEPPGKSSGVTRP